MQVPHDWFHYGVELWQSILVPGDCRQSLEVSDCVGVLVERAVAIEGEDCVAELEASVGYSVLS